jgi:hypothetical protein
MSGLFILFGRVKRLGFCFFKKTICPGLVLPAQLFYRAMRGSIGDRILTGSRRVLELPSQPASGARTPTA